MTFIPAYWYHPLHIICISILTLYAFFTVASSSNDILLYGNRRVRLVFVYAFVFTIIAGLRPITWTYFGDTYNYAIVFERYQNELLDIGEQNSEWLWDRFMYACSRVMSVNQFLLLVEFLYVFPIVLACRRWSNNNTYLLLLMGISAFSFYSYGTNGIRNGVACSFVTLALTYINGNKKEKLFCVLLCCMAITIHKSTTLPIVAMFATFFYRKPRIMFLFWVASIIISLITGDAVAGFFESLGFDDRMTSYLDASDSEIMASFSRTGFRWDFLLYSSMPLVLGWYVVFKKRVIDTNYLLLLGTYIYSNAFWIMVIRSSFSNRFAYLSWFLYPFVLGYPLLKFDLQPNQGRRLFGTVLLLHFSFTVLMYFR